MQNNPSLQRINGDFKGKDILSLDQFDTQSIEKLFAVTAEMAEIAKNAKPSDILSGNIVTLLFFEPSSRTFGSFATAIKQLGGQTLEIQDPKNVSSFAKGETLEDAMKVYESYTNAVVLRHFEVGTARKAADATEIPVINAGDGIGEHPTQALLDMYTIHEKFGRLDNLTILMAGDVRNGRTVHSLIRGLSLYPNNTIYLLSPQSLRLTPEDSSSFSKSGTKLIEITSEKDIPKNADVWYWTRVQKERFENTDEYEKVKLTFIVTEDLMKGYAKEDMILMHPLPRVGEIEERVDDDPRAVYLTRQMRNGKYVRMALIALILGKR
jgi:aspartate carbamoyltransferase